RMQFDPRDMIMQERFLEGRSALVTGSVQRSSCVSKIAKAQACRPRQRANCTTTSARPAARRSAGLSIYVQISLALRLGGSRPEFSGAGGVDLGGRDVRLGNTAGGH